MQNRNDFRSGNFSLLRLGSLLLLSLLFPASELAGIQQIGITTPFTTVSDSYYERMGVSFGGRFGAPPTNGSGTFGFFNVGGFGGPGFNQGSFGSAIPPFGGYDPNAGARFGFDRINPNGSGFGFRMELSKGNSRTISSQAPSLVVQNGFGGSIFDGRMTPFVTGVFPVVGNSFGNPSSVVIDNGVTRALASGNLDLANLGSPETGTLEADSEPVASGGSSATRGEQSVAAIREEKAARAALTLAKVEAHVKQADQYTQSGELGLARLELKRALTFEKDPSRRKTLTEKLRNLGK